jgi:hypothetical protein
MILVMQFSPPFRQFIPLRPKYSNDIDQNSHPHRIEDNITVLYIETFGYVDSIQK